MVGIECFLKQTLISSLLGPDNKAAVVYASIVSLSIYLNFLPILLIPMQFISPYQAHILLEMER